MEQSRVYPIHTLIPRVIEQVARETRRVELRERSKLCSVLPFVFCFFSLSTCFVLMRVRWSWKMLIDGDNDRSMFEDIG